MTFRVIAALLATNREMPLEKKKRKNFAVYNEREKSRCLESEFSPSWILLSQCMTLRGRKMCSVKIKNGTEYTDRCSFCPRPQHFSKSCWEPMTTTCRPGAAQTLGNPSPQANPQDLHRDSAVISFSCPGYQ